MKLFQISILDPEDHSLVHSPEYPVRARNAKHACSIFKRGWGWEASWIVKASPYKK